MMKINFRILTFLFSIWVGLLSAQTNLCELNEDSVKARLYEIVEVLSHDSLGGREAGTLYDNKAALYIKKKFEAAGLTNFLDNNDFIQEFEFVDGIKLTSDNYFRINSKSYDLMKDFFPLNISNNGKVKGEIIKVGFGISFPEKNYDDYEAFLNTTTDKNIKGKIFVIEIGVPNSLKNEINIAYHEELEKKVNLAIEKGAIAVIFICSDKSFSKPSLNFKRFEQPLKIPVLFADQMAYKTIMDSSNPFVEISVGIEKDVKTTSNVIGYIDNKAAQTIVIGAHYDHLGYGSPISRYTGEPAMHPGADDNASGISAMIELARLIKCKEVTAYNFLFVAFGAEEKGLLGSSYFVKSQVYAIEKINFMLNLDMVGRIGTLTLIGTGTSPAWDEILGKIVTTLKVQKNAHAGGGSDHASFYVQNIPVIFFFTGIHEDYHKPTDVIDKVNFSGIYDVIQYIYDLIEVSVEYKKLQFQKSSDKSRQSKRSSVTLGLTPDHAYDGIGLKVLDVAEGKPASNGGVLKGDIIVKVDIYEVRDIYSYMSALNKLKKGDKIALKVIRESEEIVLEITL